LAAADRRNGGQYRPEHLVAGCAKPDFFYACYRHMLVVTKAFLADVGFAADKYDGFTI